MTVLVVDAWRQDAVQTPGADAIEQETEPSLEEIVVNVAVEQKVTVEQHKEQVAIDQLEQTVTIEHALDEVD